jgi:hypothetical protein
MAWLSETGTGALTETIGRLGAASAFAAGVDWDEPERA